jgi:plasmid stability protein
MVNRVRAAHAGQSVEIEENRIGTATSLAIAPE